MITIIDSSSFAPGSMSRSRERALVDVAVELGRSRYHVPGEAGIWIFIFGDITLYALLSACFMLDRRKNPSLFDQAANTLHTTFGAVNAFLLLTSSLLVHSACEQCTSTSRPTLQLYSPRTSGISMPS